MAEHMTNKQLSESIDIDSISDLTLQLDSLINASTLDGSKPDPVWALVYATLLQTNILADALLGLDLELQRIAKAVGAE